MLWLPFGAVVGGALGNLADRARDGAVIDFIKPVFWPAFNLADTAIVIGILGLLYVLEGPRARPRRRRSASRSRSSRPTRAPGPTWCSADGRSSDRVRRRGG